MFHVGNHTVLGGGRTCEIDARDGVIVLFREYKFKTLLLRGISQPGLQTSFVGMRTPFSIEFWIQILFTLAIKTLLTYAGRRLSIVDTTRCRDGVCCGP